MKNYFRLLTNMYREQRIFTYNGKQCTRHIHVSYAEKNPRYLTGVITQWGKITASFICDMQDDALFAFSFKTNRIIPHNKLTKNLFRHIRGVIDNYIAIREVEEMRIPA